jgi:tetratricopeptide (TPR) repeat protein
LDPQADFLLHLSQEYLRFGLPDEALAALAQVSELSDSEGKQATLLMKLQAFHQKNDIPKLLSLGETLPKDAGLPTPAAEALASAYWQVGLKDKAHLWLKKAFTYIPSLTELRELYKGKPKISSADKASLTLQGVLVLAIKSRLGYHFALENLIPLVWRYRPTTCCFQDEVNLLADARGESPEILKELHGTLAQVLYHVFGIYTAFFTHLLHSGAGPQVKIYLGTDPALLDKAEELKELYWKVATPWPNDPSWQEIMNREADLLGFP